MTAIYHQRRTQSCLCHLFFTLRHIRRAVVRCFTTTQDHMTVRVTLGLQQANLTSLVNTDKTVWHRSGTHRVNRRRQATIGSVFKAHRHRQARRHLTVGL